MSVSHYPIVIRKESSNSKWSYESMTVTGKGAARGIQSLISVEVEVENQLVALPIPLRPKFPTRQNMAKEKRKSEAV